MKKIYTYITMVLMLSMATVTFTSCETEDQYEADTLVTGDWQGYLGTYYYDRWGLTGNTYETVIRFGSNGYGATSGRGYEVDYDTRSRFNDYAYCEFSWSIVNGVITLIYDDSMWTPVYISDYSLSSKYFSGYMDDGTRRGIQFRLENVRFGYWDNYRNGYYYDDYYYSRATRAAESDSIAAATDSIPVVNNGKSIVSGAFAKATQK
ncbi:MAG: hypothetical protein K6B13_09495 [Prevotella sp.]|nr:hypothetical protein [Prevotella sp.]